MNENDPANGPGFHDPVAAFDQLGADLTNFAKIFANYRADLIEAGFTTETAEAITLNYAQHLHAVVGMGDDE